MSLRRLEDLAFDNTYARLPEAFYAKLNPTPFSEPPYLVSFNPSAAALSSPTFLRHIGVYAYAREALLRYVRLPASELERVEKLEQLRALAAGMRIGVAVTEELAVGIDTPEDLAHAQTLLRK